MTKRQLILEDGTVFIGDGFGSDVSISGELVFNTGMTGYQEVISDPAYCGQIVTMTYPLIGNYGINRDDFEAIAPFVSGLVVKELCDYPSNFRSEESMDDFLKAHNIPLIAGIDTRKLTKLIRNNGSMKGFITDVNKSANLIIEQLKNTPNKTDQVKQTSTLKPYIVPGRGLRIVLVDFGMKHSILRELTERNCHITVVPYNYSAENILRLKPDGVLLTNGPGNPHNVPEAIAMIQAIIGELPIFGIGLGHQLFALASGAQVEKMSTGHRGNHPVKDLEKDKTFITTQNHGYTVIEASMEGTNLQLTQIALNDKTVEGIKHKLYSAFSVQYNPDGSPGPEDTKHLFDDFLQLIKYDRIRKKEEAHA